MRRILIHLLAGSLLAGACGSGDDVSVEPSSTSDQTSASTSSSLPSTTASSFTGQASTEATSSSTETTQTTTNTASTDTATTSGSTSTSSTPSEPSLGSVALRAVRVGSFDVPTAFRTHPSGTGWVAERAGRVVSFETGSIALDISGRVRERGEMGLLGIAFNRSGDRLYVSYNDRADGGATVIAEYPFADGRADGERGRDVLRVSQPYSNHNGGDIHLGPDGNLWIALGDGGSGGDPHGHGQNPDTLLGSVLRIDPSAATGDDGYAIPSDNPLVDGGGRAEVWLFGVRNPWRIHFDPDTDDLWIADVGQDRWEEVTLLPRSTGWGRGANLGWSLREGSYRFSGARPAGAVDPVHEYSHDEGCSITGGVVYRGPQIPNLAGAYLFADFCRSSVRAIRVEEGRTVDAHVYEVGVDSPIAFGTAATGEVLVLSASDGVFELRT